MKKLLSLLAVVALLTGCATWQDNAGKSLASTAKIVDAGMKGWAAYVVRANPSEETQQKVRAAYAQYQLSMDIALSSYTAAVQSKDSSVWEQASAALIASRTSLLNLLQSLEVK